MSTWKKRGLTVNSIHDGAAVILVVDDDLDVRQAVASILEMEGYRVLQAEGGSEALRLLTDRGGGVDLLLSDVRMPGMSGPELIHEIGRHWPRIRPLLMTGFAGEAFAKLTAAETTSVLQKPFHLSELTRRVEQLLETTPVEAQSP